MTKPRSQSSPKQDTPEACHSGPEHTRSTSPDDTGRSSHTVGDAGQTYTVGYGRPPQATRFQPGQSGNPRGRAKGSKNARTLLEKELSKTVTVRENGRARKRTKLEVIVAQHVNRAVSGDAKSIESVFRWSQSSSDASSTELPKTAAPASPQPAAYAPSSFLQTFLAMARDADPEALSQAFRGAELTLGSGSDGTDHDTHGAGGQP